MRWLVLALALTPTSAKNNRDLLRAVRDNNPAMVNIALKAGDKHALVGDDGDTPLMLAVRLDKYKALKALIKAKADVGVHDAAGYTCMHVAADVGAARSIQVLLTAGVDANPRHDDGLHPIHRATINGHTDALKSLLNAEVLQRPAPPPP